MPNETRAFVGGGLLTALVATTISPFFGDASVGILFGETVISIIGGMLAALLVTRGESSVG